MREPFKSVQMIPEDGWKTMTPTCLDRGVEYDFRVVASNLPSDALPSNLVTVVL